MKITPTGEGLTDITLTVTKPDTGTDAYVISYYASQQATDAAHTLYHYGATDGSAAIALDANFMLVANDENEVIGLYDRTQSGLPMKTFNFATDLAFPEKPPEMDIEDAVQVGSRIYWMGSHSDDFRRRGRADPRDNLLDGCQRDGCGDDAHVRCQVLQS